LFDLDFHLILKKFPEDENQLAIEFDRESPMRAGREFGRKHAEAGANFEHAIGWLQIRGFDDSRERRRINQKILAGFAAGLDFIFFH
jgi:hypothetical protein